MDEWVSLAARLHGDRRALVADGRSFTYAELGELAARAARRLAALGVQPGDRVATTLPPGIAFAELLHALPRLGAVLVPLSGRLTASERRLQLEEAAPSLVVDEPLDGDDEDDDAALRSSMEPDQPHTLLFTSGSTARPKPVLLTCGNHHASAAASARNLGVAPDDRWLCVLPLFHVGGLAILIRSAIYGTTAVLHDRFDADAATRSLESGEATLVSLVPTMLERMRDAGLERAPRLRAALLGGGPVPRELLEWAHVRGIPVCATYGMTETASQVVTARHWEPAGRPLDGVDVALGDDGEIMLRGPMVAPGALAPDGWLHTGDLGRLDDDGRLWVEGRAKDVIVTGGENVSAAEVEEVLCAHPAVHDAAVVARPHPEWGEAVTAFVVAADAADEELLGFCRERLAGYKVPKALHRLSSLPRTPAGKLERWKLPGAP